MSVARGISFLKDDNGNKYLPVREEYRELILGVDYDRIDVAYPSNKVEVFTYSLNGDTVQTVTMTYLKKNKKELESVVVS